MGAFVVVDDEFDDGRANCWLASVIITRTVREVIQGSHLGFVAVSDLLSLSVP
jgi:hypothetical protein